VIGTSVSPLRWGTSSEWDGVYAGKYLHILYEMVSVMKVTSQINTLDERATMFFNLTEYRGFERPSSILLGGESDLWAHSDNRTAVRNFVAHGVSTQSCRAAPPGRRGRSEGSRPPCAVTERCIGPSVVTTISL
ncbi:hypothetical protein EDD15DRAFT_2162737, partial [Pisolithus albus]